MKIIMKSGIASFGIRVILGLIFVSAGFVKAFDVPVFLFTIQQLDLLPAPTILPAAIIVIVCELCFGLSLLVGFQTRLAAALLAVLLLSFVAVLFFAIVHGKDVDCGCFGTMTSERVGLGVILRDILLIAGCLWLAARNDAKVKNVTAQRFLQ